MTCLLRHCLLWAAAIASTAASHAAEPYRDPARPVDERVRDLLGRMSLEEKIDQLTQKGADNIEMQDGTADEASLQKLFGDRSIGVLCVNSETTCSKLPRRLSAGQQYLRKQTRLGIPALTVNEGLTACWRGPRRASHPWFCRGRRGGEES